MDASANLQPTRFETADGRFLGGLRRRHDYQASEAGIAAQWREFEAWSALPGQIGDARYGVMCGHDETGMEYMCAVEVTSLTALPEGVGRMRVPPQEYAVFDHLPGSPVRGTWEGILEWLFSGPYESAHTPDFEVYPSKSHGPGSPGVEVWVGVVPRGTVPERTP